MATTYTKVRYKCSGPVDFETVFGKVTAVKTMPFTSSGKVKPFDMSSYKVREDQFCNGTASRQNEILDVLLQPGIVKGMKGVDGLRYVIDGFKSFVEGGYKSQFGQFVYNLDEKNVFVRAIVNEPFIEDLEKSTNPLFKETPSGIFDFKYLAKGGNEQFSTVFLTKGTVGQDMCFYFGPGITKGNDTEVPAGYVANVFYNKTYPFDVVANETGYISGADGLESYVDDDDRLYMEKFRWNPIIKIGAGYTIYGNWTGQLKETLQSQIQNSELLCYIKSSLYQIAQTENFKKALYKDYLRTETECTEFLNGLVNAGAIQSGFVCQCNAENNTEDIQRKRIKLVHIEYSPVDCLDKIVFDLNIN